MATDSRWRTRLRIAPAAERAIRRLSDQIQVTLLDELEELAEDPRPAACAKAKELAQHGVFRVKVGKDYRTLYQVKDEVALILVVKVADRKEIYRRLADLKLLLNVSVEDSDLKPIGDPAEDLAAIMAVQRPEPRAPALGLAREPGLLPSRLSMGEFASPLVPIRPRSAERARSGRPPGGIRGARPVVSPAEDGPGRSSLCARAAHSTERLAEDFLHVARMKEEMAGRLLRRSTADEGGVDSR